MRLNKTKFKVLLLSQGNLRYQHRLGMNRSEQPCPEGLGGAGMAGHDPATCTHSPETKHLLGCIQSSVGSRGRRGFCASALLCSGETPPAELHPALGSQHRMDMELSD